MGRTRFKRKQCVPDERGERLRKRVTNNVKTVDAYTPGSYRASGDNAFGVDRRRSNPPRNAKVGTGVIKNDTISVDEHRKRVTKNVETDDAYTSGSYHVSGDNAFCVD